MILVDTSVWIEHFRNGHTELIELINDVQVACHPFIIGELACGSLNNRAVILSLLQALPVATLAEHTEVLSLIENHKLMNRGLGYVDIHLLTATVLTGIPLWTLDKRLNQVSAELGVDYRV